MVVRYSGCFLLFLIPIDRSLVSYYYQYFETLKIHLCIDIVMVAFFIF